MPLRPIELVGDQLDVLFLPCKNPVFISGVAGCGKTTVALYRAKHLVCTYMDLFTETTIGIFTFNKSLIKYMNSLLPVIPGGYQKDSAERLPVAPGLANIKKTNFHKWAYHFLRERGMNFTTLESAQVHEKVKVARSRYLNEKISQKSVEFFMEEISYLKGLGIKSLEEYQSMKRIGRGLKDRVLRKDRHVVWGIYQDYKQLMKAANCVDFDDYALLCIDLLTEEDRTFSHIIIDEAQDLSKMQIMCLAKLVKNETKSITIIADEAQKIYKTPFSWRDTGINLQGRKRVLLNKNYRNTYEIAAAAYSLLDHDPLKHEYVEGLLDDENHGCKPVVYGFRHERSQYSQLVSEILNIMEQDPHASIAVLHRNAKEVSTLYSMLSHDKISCQLIIDDKTQNYDYTKVCVCTMSSIKGLEFDYVFIVSLNDNIIPYSFNIDKEDLDEQISTDRRLLYVSMTRARYVLYMYYYGAPSMFLNEIDPQKVRRLADTDKADEFEKNAMQDGDLADSDDLPF